MNGNIRQRTPGSWTIQWYLGRGSDGKKKVKSQTFSGPNAKKRAESELRRVLRELETGSYVEETKLSVGDFLMRWLKDYAATSVAGKTYERYEEIVKRHLIPALGGIPLHKLQPAQVQTYLRESQESGRIRGKGALSPLTVKHHFSVLRKALNCAVRWQVVGRNVCDAVDAPRVVTKERQAFTEDEIHTLVRSTDGGRYGPLVLIAASTGMRLGEVLASTWADLDTDHGAISVTKSLEQTRKGLAIKEPKSAKGRRLIPLPANVVTRLLAYREQQEAQAEAAGELWAGHDLICADEIGGFIRPDVIGHVFPDLAAKVGVRRLGIHALRHGHASMLCNRGWNAKIIQERLGHSTIAVTMDIYSHLLPTTQQEAADSLAEVF